LARPPSPTLFPYTTLFRSGAEPVRRVPAPASCLPMQPPLGAVLLRGDGRPGVGRDDPALHRARCARADEALSDPAPRLSLSTLPDRKSTRLNSSHVAISYA